MLPPVADPLGGEVTRHLPDQPGVQVVRTAVALVVVETAEPIRLAVPVDGVEVDVDVTARAVDHLRLRTGQTFVPRVVGPVLTGREQFALVVGDP